jgi:riboflavin kinase/FMN adenylyltransferase
MTRDSFTILNDGDAVPDRLRGGVVAIGNFDGVHRGHQAVLAQVRDMARQRGVAALALTFEPHPRVFFRPDIPLFRLTPPEEKAELLAALGLDGVVVATFDKTLAAMTAEEFVDRILVERLAASVAVVGYDFHFGKGRAGSPDLLRARGLARGFEVAVIGPAGEGDTVWSASAARSALEAGRVDEAARMLGFHWFVRGDVVHGEKRGRELGFPTANIRLPDGTGLKHGVYAVRMRVDGVTHDGVANFGRRPQFDNGAPLLEVFLVDTTIDLYGRHVQVEFIGFIRPELRFATVDDLIARMHDDVARARVILAGSEAPGTGNLSRALGGASGSASR